MDEEFDKMTKEQLLKMYQAYSKLKNKEGIEKLKQRERVNRYYKTDKGKAKLAETQKRYYQRNKEKILKKYHERRKAQKKQKEKTKDVAIDQLSETEILNIVNDLEKKT